MESPVIKHIRSFHFFKSFCLLAENTNFALSVILSNRLVSMTKFFVFVTVFSVVFSSSVKVFPGLFTDSD